MHVADRLRVTVKDAEKLEQKNSGKQKALWACYEGPRCSSYLRTKADVLKSDVQDLLDSSEVIPETLPSQKQNQQLPKFLAKGVTEEVETVRRSSHTWQMLKIQYSQ